MEKPTRSTLLQSTLLPFAGMAGLPSIAAAVQQASSPYRRPKLKHRYRVHVRVYTDQGIIGQGESTDAAQGNVPLIQSFARQLPGGKCATGCASPRIPDRAK